MAEENAYHAMHSVYVETHPRSDPSELEFRKQAAHYVTEAVITVKPVAHHSWCKQSGMPGILSYSQSAAGTYIQESKDGRLSEHPMCNRFFTLQ